MKAADAISSMLKDREAIENKGGRLRRRLGAYTVIVPQEKN